MKFKKFAKQLWKDESAQGMTEYILLLVAVVVLVGLFRTQITDKLKGLIGSLSGKIDEASQ